MSVVCETDVRETRRADPKGKSRSSRVAIPSRSTLPLSDQWCSSLTLHQSNISLKVETNATGELRRMSSSGQRGSGANSNPVTMDQELQRLRRSCPSAMSVILASSLLQLGPTTWLRRFLTQHDLVISRDSDKDYLYILAPRSGEVNSSFSSSRYVSELQVSLCRFA